VAAPAHKLDTGKTAYKLRFFYFLEKHTSKSEKVHALSLCGINLFFCGSIP
jgi:hypothetical protein